MLFDTFTRSFSWNDAATFMIVAPPQDLALVERICKAVPLPVNAMHFPGAPTREQWASAGIARISHGPFPHMDLMAALTAMAKAVID